MSLSDLMADFLSADRKPVIEADPSGAGPSCLNSSPDSHDERHSETPKEDLSTASLLPDSSMYQATSNQGEKAERPVVSAQSGRHLKPALPKKAQIYTAVIDGKEVTLIDTNALPVNEFIQGVRRRFGCERVDSVAASID